LKTAIAALIMLSFVGVTSQTPAQQPQPLRPTIETSLQRRTQPDEIVSVLIKLRSDGPQTPFARRQIVTTEAGRATEREIHQILRAGNAVYSKAAGNGRIAAMLPLRGIDGLRTHPRIDTIAEIGNHETFGTTTSARRIAAILPSSGSIPFLNEGALQTVVVIDMGFDPTNPAIAARVIEERCYSPQANFCPGGTSSANGPGKSRPLTLGPPGANYHGTSVAAVIASQPGITLQNQFAVGSSVTENGGAPMVNLILISAQFRWATSTNPNEIDIEGAWEALDWVIAQYDAGRRDIKAVNLSFGSNISHPCASDSNYATYAQKFLALKDRGIAVVAGSGNNSSATIAIPACVPNAISVAQSFNEPAFQTEVYSSSVGPKLTVVAPAGPINLPGSTVQSGQSSPQPRMLIGMTSTSFASPLVASCAAIIGKQLGVVPINVASLITALSSSPASASTPTSTYPLLSCLQAYTLISSGASLVSLNRYGLSGTFYDQATPGQGFVWELTQTYGGGQGGNLFGAWFTFGPAQNPYHERGQRWYTIQSDLVQFHSLLTALPVGIYDNGPGVFVGPKDPAFTSTLVGSGCIRFKSCLNAELTYKWNAEAGFDACAATPGPGPGTGQNNVRRISVERETSYQCSESTKGSGSAGWETAAQHDIPRGVTGSWVRLSPPLAYDSQGWIIDVNPDLALNAGGLFGAWFTYPGPGDNAPVGERKRWFTLQGGRKLGSPTRYEFDIYFTRNGILGVGIPAPTTGLPVGTATLQFVSCTQAQFSYSFNTSVGSELTGIGGTSGTFPVGKLSPANSAPCQVAQ